MILGKVMRLFDLFKRKMKKSLTWEDIKLWQFKEMQEVIKIEDDTERTIALCEIIFGEDVTSLPLPQFKKRMSEVSFISGEMPYKVPRKSLKVNGRDYYTDCILGNVTTAQYIDYTNLSKEGDIAKMLSVFIIPKGHKYNDGYDIQLVWDDINDLDVITVNGFSVFFRKQLLKFIQIFQHSLAKDLKQNKNKEAVKAIDGVMNLTVKAIEEMTAL